MASSCTLPALLLLLLLCAYHLTPHALATIVPPPPLDHHPSLGSSPIASHSPPLPDPSSNYGATNGVSSTGIATTFCKGKLNGLYEDPHSCDYFWVCWDNGFHGSRLLCPPNTLWNPSAFKCTHLHDLPHYHTGKIAKCIRTLFPHHRRHHPYEKKSISYIPVWNWNGLVQCYTADCFVPGSPPTLNVGIPCHDADNLFSIAENNSMVWIPAPRSTQNGHGFNDLGSNHWKVKFDKVDKNTSNSLNLLKASLIDYSPSQIIQSNWQGGPKQDYPAQFLVKGPLVGSLGQCYYGVGLENPDIHVWGPFAKALLNESNLRGNTIIKANTISPTTSPTLINESNLRGNTIISANTISPTTSPTLATLTNTLPPQPAIVPTTTGFLPPQPAIVPTTTGFLPPQPAILPTTSIPPPSLVQNKIPSFTNGFGDNLTIQDCINNVPWTDLLSTALCYAYNFVGTSTLGPCTTFSSTDISTITNCFGTILSFMNKLGP